MARSKARVADVAADSSPSSARNTSIFDSPIDECTNARWSAMAGSSLATPVVSIACTNARSTRPSSRTVVPAMSSTASWVALASAGRRVSRLVGHAPARMVASASWWCCLARSWDEKRLRTTPSGSMT